MPIAQVHTYFYPFEVFDHFEAYFHLGFAGLPY